MTSFRRLVRDEPEAIGSLFSRLIDDGKRYARAEVDFYKQVTLRRVAGMKMAVILAVVAIFLVQSSLTTLLIGLGLSLARLLGAGAGGGVVAVAILGLIVSGLLLRSAAARFSVAASADAAVADADGKAK